ncbi:HEAT repeat domain-containing protein [Lusitaniella coriacea LEGE 07157]|uniref:HEAT repeat domain-containing protein n=1 Tax=Lusitaniella coriacea LEGE 07157 TaxID=945747 RepID=A0A8J7DX26_9CYAN|nr:HEAT repeat domain-containing protein [Lusitaniella coriacea]MBE9116693.1 HEAT repeat domain-containing protein [Lusitaniella coriacea LEGE 07157]
MSVTLESVGQLLNSEDYGDRLTGLNQLRQIDPASAFQLIQPLITDPHARVRYAAVSQMDTLGQQDLKVSLELLRDRIKTDKEVDVRAAAADAIAGLKLTEAFDDLKELYQETDDWLIHTSILAALGEMGDPRGFEPLAEALNSDNSLLQTVAIGALGELGDDRAVPLLISFVSNEDWQIRYRLAQALSRLGGSQARMTLERLAMDEVEIIAQAAKEGLNTSA